MTLFIDPPLWPAHGTVFSHLISDADLEQLHRFAHKQGLSPRAFDLDHYDVPVHRREQLIAAGARAVTAGELTRRLQASGLRIPAKERPAQIRRALLTRWERLLPGHPEIGRSLLTRWDEPHRRYHTSVHLREVLERIELLGGGLTPESHRVLGLAAWYHDAVYAARPGQDEQASAQLCHRELDGRVAPQTLDRAITLIEQTAGYARPDILSPYAADAQLWAVFHDADLGILAASPSRYLRYAAAVREEYSMVPDAIFQEGRARLLRGFLERERLFHTAEAHRVWETPARENLRIELEQLHAG